MKKYISILFLSIAMLSSNSDILELVKLPSLITHFNEHKQWDAKISFLGFMYMHYLEDNNKFGDYKRDMEMPFKTHDHSCISIFSFLELPQKYSLVSKTVYQKTEQKIITNCSVYSTQYLSAIWQPPKV